jgi:tight adherence protein B
MKQVLYGLLVVAIVALLEGLGHTFRFFSDKQGEELRRRLQSLGGVEAAGITLLRQGRLAANSFIDSILRGIPLAERLELLIEQAQVDITVARLMTYSAVAGIFGTLLGILMLGPALSPMITVMALLVPVFVVYAIRQQRSVKLSEQLPDALDMMSRSLRAGHALPSSFKLVATEMPAPVSIEFGRAFEEQNLGLAFERAVVQMTRRAPTNADLKLFAVSVIIQKETGGNLVEIIEKIAETIRSRYRFYGKLRALTAEARVSAWVIGALPFVAGLATFAVNPQYMSQLFTKPMGKLFLAYAIGSWVFGVFMLRKVSEVDY